MRKRSRRWSRDGFRAQVTGAIKSLWLPGSVRKALILLTCVALVPVVAIQAWIYYSWFQLRVSEEMRVNLELARSVGSSFRAYVRDISRQEFTLGMAMASLEPFSPARAGRFLDETRLQYTAITAFRWANPEGLIVASSDPDSIGIDVGDRTYFRAVMGKEETAVSDLLLDRGSGRQVIIVARGIYGDDRQLRGVVLATIDPRLLGQNAIPVIQPEKGSVALFDRQGTVVFHKPRNASFPDDSPDSDPLLVQALAGEEATGTIISPINGDRAVAARTPISGIDWAAGASRLETQMLSPIFQTLFFNIGMLTIVMILSFMMAFSITGGILRALNRLNQHAFAIGEGRLEHRAEAGGFAELSALADSFNVMAAQLLERRRAEERATEELTRTNQELDAFAYSVSHDLRGPLRSIDGFSQALLEDYDALLDEQGRDHLRRVRAASQRMGQLIDDLLKLSRVTRAEMKREEVNLSELARRITADLEWQDPGRNCRFIIQPDLRVEADGALLRVALENLLGNAWKFTKDQPQAIIELGILEQESGLAYFVRDNGAGFDMAYVGRLFGAFQRLHTTQEFPGTGIGLATVQRIIHRHGGTIWAAGELGKGATFYFTL